MARFLSPGRSPVFGFLLTALVLAAQQPGKWDALLSDSIAAINDGNAGQAIQLLLPLYEQAKTWPAEDVRRVETALVLARTYQYHGQLNQAEPLYLEAIEWLEARRDKSESLLALAFDDLGGFDWSRDAGRKPRTSSVRLEIFTAKRGMCEIHASRTLTGC